MVDSATSTTSTLNQTVKPFRVLCIDGGGIRGIIPAIWLAELEKRIKRNNRHIELRQCFKLVCGTSTGAILAAAVTKGISASAIVDMYADNGSEIFRRRAYERIPMIGMMSNWIHSKYSSRYLQRELEQAFGNDEINDFDCELCITSYDIKNRRPVIFRSYVEAYNKEIVWKACLASSSAPTYFPVYKMKMQDLSVRFLVDGGMFANNPSALALADSIRILKKDSLYQIQRNPIEIISLGTGDATRNLSRQVNGNQGQYKWARPVIDVMFDGTANVSSYITDKILPEGDYKRLNFPLDANLGSDDLDNVQPENIENLSGAARSFIHNEGETAFNEIYKMITRTAPMKRRKSLSR